MEFTEWLEPIGEISVLALACVQSSTDPDEKFEGKRSFNDLRRLLRQPEFYKQTSGVKITRTIFQEHP